MIPGPIDEMYHMTKINDRLKKVEQERIANRVILEKREAERAVKKVLHRRQKEHRAQEWVLMPIITLFNGIFKSSNV